jgi:hypothetical protein
MLLIFSKPAETSPPGIDNQRFGTVRPDDRLIRLPATEINC